MKSEREKLLEERVAFLEKKLKSYESDHIKARSYVAMVHYIEDGNKLMLRMDADTAKSKERDNSLGDQARKYMAEMMDRLEDLDKLEKLLTKDLIKEAEKDYAGSLEESIAAIEEEQKLKEESSEEDE